MEYEEDVIQLGKQAIKVNTRLATGRYGKLSDAQQKHADELVKKLRYLICYPAIDTPIPQETVGIPKEGPPSLTQPGEIPADDGLREQSDGDKQVFCMSCICRLSPVMGEVDWDVRCGFPNWHGCKKIPNELRGVADEALKIYNKLLDLAPKARSPNLEIALFHLCRSLESASSDWDCQPSSNSVSSSVTEPVARTPQSTAPSSNHDGFPTSTTLTPALITEICPANLAGHICYKRDCKMRLLCELPWDECAGSGCPYLHGVKPTCLRMVNDGFCCREECPDGHDLIEYRTASWATSKHHTPNLEWSRWNTGW